MYGQDDGSWVDESSPTEPREFSGRRVLEGEGIAPDIEVKTAAGDFAARDNDQTGKGVAAAVLTMAATPLAVLMQRPDLTPPAEGKEYIVKDGDIVHIRSSL